MKCQAFFAYPVNLQGSMGRSIVLVIASSLRTWAVNATFLPASFDRGDGNPTRGQGKGWWSDPQSEQHSRAGKSQWCSDPCPQGQDGGRNTIPTYDLASQTEPAIVRVFTACGTRRPRLRHGLKNSMAVGPPCRRPYLPWRIPTRGSGGGVPLRSDCRFKSEPSVYEARSGR